MQAAKLKLPPGKYENYVATCNRYNGSTRPVQHKAYDDPYAVDWVEDWTPATSSCLRRSMYRKKRHMNVAGLGNDDRSIRTITVARVRKSSSLTFRPSSRTLLAS
jgi:hypothetical protein